MGLQHPQGRQGPGPGTARGLCLPSLLWHRSARREVRVTTPASTGAHGPVSLPGVLARFVLDHVLGVSGLGTVRSTRGHLGAVPSQHFHR